MKFLPNQSGPLPLDQTYRSPAAPGQRVAAALLGAHHSDAARLAHGA